MIGRSFAARWRLALCAAFAAVYLLVYAAFEIDLRLLHCREPRPDKEARDGREAGP